MGPPPRRSIRGRDIAAVAGAVTAYGLAFGVLASGSGLTVGQVAAMSLLVFAGGSQFAFVGVLAAGGAPVSAAVSALLLNTRLAAFGVIVAPLLSRGGWRWWVGTHLIADENVAMATVVAPEQQRRVYWRVSTSIFLAWNVSTIMGAAVGAGIEPEPLGLDVAFPATFVALLVPLLRRQGAVIAAVIGCLVAVAMTPVLPAGLPVSLAVTGAIVGMVVNRRRGVVGAPVRDQEVR